MSKTKNSGPWKNADNADRSSKLQQQQQRSNPGGGGRPSSSSGSNSGGGGPDAHLKFQSIQAEADKLALSGMYTEAIELYTRALTVQPNDLNALVNRSRCHMMMGDNLEAVKDADKVFEIDPTYIRGVYQRAEALYSKGDFEEALLLYHRGHQARPDIQGFSVGIVKATESIRGALALINTDKVK
jgi:tetratricopeptide (TPR) repeat protein